MDVIQPQLIRIANRCYRKNPVAPSWGTTEREIELRASENDPKLSGPYEVDDYDSEVPEIDVPIKERDDGSYRIDMPVPSDYFPKIIGKGGETKKQIERDTRTQIIIPKKGQSGDIIITGFEYKGVVSAYTQIELLVLNARKQLRKTHFISLPLSSPKIKARFLEFQRQLLTSKIAGVDESLFQNPDKLHVTIGLLVLLSEDEKSKAASIFQSFYDGAMEIIEEEPLLMKLEGIDYMNDDPSQVNVLYGQCVDVSGRLQRLADSVVDHFEARGLLDREYERVKLHVTLMNTKFTASSSEGGALSRPNRRYFNAKSILEKFKGFTFGSQTVDVLHLSERHTTSPSTGYYQSISELHLKQDYDQ